MRPPKARVYTQKNSQGLNPGVSTVRRRRLTVTRWGGASGVWCPGNQGRQGRMVHCVKCHWQGGQNKDREAPTGFGDGKLTLASRWVKKTGWKVAETERDVGKNKGRHLLPSQSLTKENGCLYRKGSRLFLDKKKHTHICVPMTLTHDRETFWWCKRGRDLPELCSSTDETERSRVPRWREGLDGSAGGSKEEGRLWGEWGRESMGPFPQDRCSIFRKLRNMVICSDQGYRSVRIWKKGWKESPERMEKWI